MTNTLSINNPANFIFTLENTLYRYEAAPTDAMKRVVLGRQTVKGIKWAIEFLKSLDVDFMNEKQLQHAIRLTYFRGSVCPAFHN